MAPWFYHFNPAVESVTVYLVPFLVRSLVHRNWFGSSCSRYSVNPQMASESKSKSRNNTNTNKNTTKRKQRYLPYNSSVKKGSYPLRPGVQGFFTTCDGGRERQASHESTNFIDSFYEVLVHGKASGIKLGQLPFKPLNKKTKFTYSDPSSSDDDDDDDDDDDQKEKEEDKDKPGTHAEDDANHESSINANPDPHKQEEIKMIIKRLLHVIKVQKLKRHFNNLDSGCNGVVFVQICKKDGDPSPKDIVQHMIMSIASTRKHMSRCTEGSQSGFNQVHLKECYLSNYASEDEITRAIQPLISQYFPVETQTALKFAVLYEARANTGVDRMKIINAVAKSVPAPHKVDLNNPDKSIVVHIVKTMCLMGVVEKYKELAKYNLRQLSSKQ
ncbi:hypothetical protein ACSBR2_033520 [Camellia fascicularis]